MLVFSEVNTEQAEDILYCDRLSLSISLFLCSNTARTLGGGMGRLTSPVSITASQNIHEMCPAERLPFTPSHPLHIPHSTSTGRVSLLKGKQKSVQTDSFSALRLFTFCTYTEPQSDLPQASPLPPDTARHSPKPPLLSKRFDMQTAVTVW